MKRNNEISLGDGIREFLGSSKILEKYKEAMLIESWEKTFGNGIQKYVTEMAVRNDVLYVKFSSSALRQELSMQKSKIIEVLVEDSGFTELKDIKFI